MAETVNGLYKAEVIHRRGPWRSFEAVEHATLEWVHWFNHRRLLEPIGNIPPQKPTTMPCWTTFPWRVTQNNRPLCQRQAERRHCIIHHWRHPLVIAPGEHARRDQLAQLLDQHLLADARHPALQFAKSPGAALEVEEDQRLPVAAYHGERDVEAAHGFGVFLKSCLHLPSGRF